MYSQKSIFGEGQNVNDKTINAHPIGFADYFSSGGCSSTTNGLEEVEGTGLTYSENFKSYDGLDEREHVEF